MVQASPGINTTPFLKDNQIRAVGVAQVVELLSSKSSKLEAQGSNLRNAKQHKAKQNKSKITKSTRAGGMAKVVENLSSKHKTEFKPQCYKKKKKEVDALED
jgi:hypothetical protein